VGGDLRRGPDIGRRFNLFGYGRPRVENAWHSFQLDDLPFRHIPRALKMKRIHLIIGVNRIRFCLREGCREACHAIFRHARPDHRRAVVKRISRGNCLLES
jgi:hypothetical protein